LWFVLALRRSGLDVRFSAGLFAVGQDALVGLEFRLQAAAQQLTQAKAWTLNSRSGGNS
jgi:hypothetical protein